MGCTGQTEYVPPYHPEFGYLCPSPGVRRSLRLALVSGAVGMVIGAVTVLSLLDKRLAQTAASGDTSALASSDRNDIEGDKFPVLASWNGVLSKEVALPLPEDCRESVRSFFDRSCRFVRKHRPSGTRSATRLGSVGIGRSDPAERAPEHEPAIIDVGSLRANAGQGGEGKATSTHTSVSAETPTKVARARKHADVPNRDGVKAFASAGLLGTDAGLLKN